MSAGATASTAAAQRARAGDCQASRYLPCLQTRCNKNHADQDLTSKRRRFALPNEPSREAPFLFQPLQQRAMVSKAHKGEVNFYSQA